MKTDDNGKSRRTRTTTRLCVGQAAISGKYSGNVHALPDIILSAWILFRIKPTKCVRDFVAGVEKVL